MNEQELRKRLENAVRGRVIHPPGTASLVAELLATADALKNVAQQIDRLDRDKHPAVCGTEEAVILHCSGPLVAQALEALAQRLTLEK